MNKGNKITKTAEKRERHLFSISGKRIKNVHTIRSRFGFMVSALFGAAGLITLVIFYVLGLFDFSAPLFRNKTALILAMSFSCIAIGIGLCVIPIVETVKLIQRRNKK